MQVKLSVVIITYNEEKNIARCLDSILDIADEIIVLDSFSTDRTKEICLSKGVQFFEHTFEGHIEQKNRAITHATFPHIFSLDADEALTEKLKNNIQHIKNNWEEDGYVINRLTNYCGTWIKHGGWYPDKKLRLWDSRKGKWTGTNPHDKFELQFGSKIKHLQGDLLHYSFYSIQQHIAQVNYFTDITANTLYKKGVHSNLYHILVKPWFKFSRDYIFRLGFLDGFYGFCIASISAHAHFLRYAKLYSLRKSK